MEISHVQENQQIGAQEVGQLPQPNLNEQSQGSIPVSQGCAASQQPANLINNANEEQKEESKQAPIISKKVSETIAKTQNLPSQSDNLLIINGPQNNSQQSQQEEEEDDVLADFTGCDEYSQEQIAHLIALKSKNQLGQDPNQKPFVKDYKCITEYMSDEFWLEVEFRAEIRYALINKLNLKRKQIQQRLQKGQLKLFAGFRKDTDRLVQIEELKKKHADAIAEHCQLMKREIEKKQHN